MAKFDSASYILPCGQLPHIRNFVVDQRAKVVTRCTCGSDGRVGLRTCNGSDRPEIRVHSGEYNPTSFFVVILTELNYFYFFCHTQFFLSITSFFHTLSLSRSLSNSLETSLTTIALAYFPWDSFTRPFASSDMYVLGNPCYYTQLIVRKDPG